MDRSRIDPGSIQYRSRIDPKTIVLQIYLDFMIQMCSNCEKRSPEGPKRLQYGPKAPLGASGGVLGQARGQK